MWMQDFAHSTLIGEALGMSLSHTFPSPSCGVSTHQSLLLQFGLKSSFQNDVEMCLKPAVAP